MVPMDYDNEAPVEGGRAGAGRYAFKVEEAEEARFNNGSKGMMCTLLVDVGSRDVKCRFVRFSYKPTALWKLKEFMESVGLDYHGKNEVHDFVGRLGLADFIVGESGYIEPKTFLPKGSELPPPPKKSNGTAAKKPAQSPDADDVPW